MGFRNKKRGTKKEAEAGTDGEEGKNGLPMANVVRLMKHAVPTKTKIAAEAKQLTHDCAVEFVGFVVGEACERAKAEHRRTMAPEDFTASFRELGFDRYVEPMETYIHGYREFERAGGSTGGSRRFVPPPPPAAAPQLSAGGPTFTKEELDFLRSVIPSPRKGYDGASTSSAGAPPPTEHGYGYGYGGYM